MVAADLGFEEGGGGCPDFGPDLLGGSTSGNDLWVGVMGPDAAHQEGFGRIQPQGVQ